MRFRYEPQAIMDALMLVETMSNASHNEAEDIAVSEAKRAYGEACLHRRNLLKGDSIEDMMGEMSCLELVRCIYLSVFASDDEILESEGDMMPRQTPSERLLAMSNAWSAIAFYIYSYGTGEMPDDLRIRWSACKQKNAQSLRMLRSKMLNGHYIRPSR